MGSMLRRVPFRFAVNLISLFGVISIYIAIRHVLAVEDSSMVIELAILASLFLLFFPLVITLPSGSSFRPGMAFVLFALLNFDYKMVILVALPAALYSALGKKKLQNRFFLMVGHLSLGIYAAGALYHAILPVFSTGYYAYAVIVLSLFVHFVVNRVTSLVIIAYRKQKSLKRQFSSILKDFNWGYICTYTISILMFLVYQVDRVPGLLLGTLLLLAIYPSFTYYQKLKIMEEKVYLDVLTKAESRLSWEEFSTAMKKKNAPTSGVVYMMDLDYFKSVNDTYGHEFGDRILQEFVSHIRNEMNRKYRLFRYGGDEFILFVHADEKSISLICEEINRMIYKQNEIWKKKGLSVAISFGNAFTSEKEPFETTVNKADKVMYQHKFSRNIVGRK